MFIELVTVESTDGRGRKRTRLEGRASCDRCGIIFQRGNYNWRACIDDPSRLTFCSSVCSRAERRRGGLSDSRLRKINLEKCGVEHALQRPDVRERSRQTMLDRYGVDSPLKHATIQQRVRDTLQERYGANNAYHIPSNVAKLDYEVIMSKRLATMRRNKTFQSSRAEERLYEELTKKFMNVSRQVRIPGTRWIIDFYVKDIDTWIQVDGVYWHGLDRPLAEIRESTKPRDQKIARAWENDRVQDAWFVERKMRLIRITDRDVVSELHPCHDLAMPEKASSKSIELDEACPV